MGERLKELAEAARAALGAFAPPRLSEAIELAREGLRPDAFVGEDARLASWLARAAAEAHRTWTREAKFARWASGLEAASREGVVVREHAAVGVTAGRRRRPLPLGPKLEVRVTAGARSYEEVAPQLLLGLALLAEEAMRWATPARRRPLDEDVAEAWGAALGASVGAAVVHANGEEIAA